MGKDAGIKRFRAQLRYGISSGHCEPSEQRLKDAIFGAKPREIRTIRRAARIALWSAPFVTSWVSRFIGPPPMSAERNVARDGGKRWSDGDRAVFGRAVSVFASHRW